MTFLQLLPSIIFISFTSAVYVYFATLFNINGLWLPFISWSVYFFAGGKKSFLPKIIFCFTAGILIGFLTVVLGGMLSSVFSAGIALPVVVFFMVMLILLAELVKSVDMIPVYFFGYSSYFAYYYGRFGGESVVPGKVLPEIWFLLMLGLGLGIFTSEGRKKLIKNQHGKEKK